MGGGARRACHVPIREAQCLDNLCALGVRRGRCGARASPHRKGPPPGDTSHTGLRPTPQTLRTNFQTLRTNFQTMRLSTALSCPAQRGRSPLVGRAASWERRAEEISRPFLGHAQVRRLAPYTRWALELETPL